MQYMLERKEDGVQEDGKWLFRAVTSRFSPGYYGEEEKACAPARVSDDVEDPQASVPGEGCSDFVMPLDAKGRPDFGPQISGSLAAWRAAHPTALVANFGGRFGLIDADLAALRGIRALDMSWCGITDAGLAHLRGIHTLMMYNCDNITGAGFAHLRGLHTLDLRYCRGITGAGLVHLRGLHALSIFKCDGITYAAAQAAKRALGIPVKYDYVVVEDGDSDKRSAELLPLALALLADEKVQEQWRHFDLHYQ